MASSIVPDGGNPWCRDEYVDWSTKSAGKLDEAGKWRQQHHGVPSVRVEESGKAPRDNSEFGVEPDGRSVHEVVVKRGRK